ncbi:XRE family transcriptional regulator [Streptomyces sp. NPDC059862]|uniref:XRE family transcriptional regulator n=1 Tax=Streptomyces sp. NPDC059862 TaxID=3346975 RepID=UPI00365E55E7
MTPLSVPEQPDAGPPSRRGRKPESIWEEVSASHRAWLEPVRSRLFASGLTLDDLVNRSGYSKSRISELLRGKGYYPGWEITYSVVRALDIPVWPLRRLWTAAAREAEKDSAWIASRIHEVQPLEPEQPPLAHQGFTEAVRQPYTAYARAFLQSDRRAQWVVAEAFDILWLGWGEVVASANARRHAWRLLRSRVLLGAHHHPDGHPDLRPAAFATVDQSQIDDLAARFARIGELSDFFDAVGRLPQDQLDVTVLRYLCGIDSDAIPGIVGLSPAITHTVDHHARGALEGTYHRRDNPGVINPQ